MARTSEATTRETRGAGSVYWTRPNSNIGAMAFEGAGCWLSLCSQVSSDDIPDGRYLRFLVRSLVRSHDRMVKAQTLHSALGAVLQFHG